MKPLVILLIVLGGFFALFCIVALIQRRLHPDGYEASPQQIRADLQKILDERDPYAIDDFVSVSLKDPRLEAIRQRIERLGEEFPPESPRQYCGPGGTEVIREYVRELEREEV